MALVWHEVLELTATGYEFPCFHAIYIEHSSKKKEQYICHMIKYPVHEFSGRLTVDFYVLFHKVSVECLLFCIAYHFVGVRLDG